MSKQIFTVFACDEWKSQDSMRLLMATTSIRKLASFIARKIADETFSYNKGESLSVSQQVKLFNSDFESDSRENIANHLDYCYISRCFDGEEI